MKSKKANPIDVHVGQRLRQRRVLLGLSQEKLADAAGVSFQMIQKYEKGSCRVGASRLMVIARALDCPVAFFFDDFSGDRAPALKVSEEHAKLDDDILSQRETIELLKAYYALPEASRKHILGMVKGLKKDDKATGKDD